MSKHIGISELRFLASAAAGWIISALILSLLTGLCLSMLKVEEAAMGYIISALSFSSAVYAGAAAMRARKRGALYTGLLSGLVITVFSLTIGFVIAGNEILSDGVLSVVTFTISGALVGSVFFSGVWRAKKPVKKRIRRP